MKIAFLFPGQGSQFPGMGKEIYEKYKEAQQIYTRANKILNMDTQKLCFESDEEKLKKTENAQLAIALTSLSILEVLKNNNINAKYAVGLSLGEYVALTYAGYLSLENCLKLLQKRGYYMENFIPDEEYSMAAVIGLESKKIEEVCKEIREKGKFVMPSNYNYSNQTVISGNTKAVEEAVKTLKESGARKVVELKTGGPFHTEKLQEASKIYKKELEKIDFNQDEKQVKVIKNIDGEEYKVTDNIKEILAEHIVKPVRFDKTIETLRKNEVDTFIEIGPGKSMTGFIRKELKGMDIKCFNIQTAEDIEQLLKEVN